MSINKHLYGKVFISHSSVNKPFVRRLVKAIEADGFQTWLDEKELLPGDSLAKRVSEGLTQARAVIVVVSKAAIASQWLAFELNKASDRSVKGECIVIPVVIEAVADLPPEVQGLLYADFSKSFKQPMHAVLNALNRDVESRIKDRHFYQQVESLLDKVFDSRGFSFTNGEYKSNDEDLVYFKDDQGTEHSAAYETLAAYGSAPKPFSSHGVTELEQALGNSTEILRLVISERPITAQNLVRTSRPNIHVWPVGGSSDPDGYIVFADLSSTSDKDGRISILKAARCVLEEKTKELADGRAITRKMWATGKGSTLRQALGLDNESDGSGLSRER